MSSRSMLLLFWREAKKHRALLWRSVVFDVMNSCAQSALIPLALSILLGHETPTKRTSAAAGWLLLIGGLAIKVWAERCRIHYRRTLAARGHEGLAGKLRQSFAQSKQSSEAYPTSNATASNFFGAWNRLLYVIQSDLLPLAVSLVSMFVVLWITMSLLTASIIIGAGIGITGVYLKCMLALGQCSHKSFERQTALGSAQTEEFECLRQARGMGWLVDELKRSVRNVSRQLRRADEQLTRVVAGRVTHTNILIALWTIATITIAQLAPSNLMQGNIVLLAYYTITLGGSLHTVYHIVEATRTAIADSQAATTLITKSAALPKLPGSPGSTRIEMRRVRATYKSEDGNHEVALPDCTLSSGSITLLIGAMGTGKSTFLGVLAGQVDFSGTVLVNGYDVREFDGSSFFHTTNQSLSRTSLRFGRLFGRDGDPHLRDWALEIAGCPDLPSDTPEKKLSGGQLQVARTAAAIYHAMRKGGVLALDEPTNNLDDTAVGQQIKGYRLIQERYPGLIIVIASHDPRLREGLADQVLYFS